MANANILQSNTIKPDSKFLQTLNGQLGAKNNKLMIENAELKTKIMRLEKVIKDIISYTKEVEL